MTAHRPARINPDTLPVLVLASALTAALAVTSFLLTFAALSDVARWAAVPDSLAWAVPVMLDGAIVVYTLAVLVARARGERAVPAWIGLAGFTAVSVIANAAHAADVPPAVQAALGVTIAGLAPLAVMLATHTLARLIVAHDRPTEAATDLEHTADVAQLEHAADVFTDTAPLSVVEPSALALAPVAAAAAPARATTTVKAPRWDDLDTSKTLARELRAEGLSVRAIAERVGLSKTTVANTVRDVIPNGAPACPTPPPPA